MANPQKHSEQFSPKTPSASAKPKRSASKLRSQSHSPPSKNPHSLLTAFPARAPPHSASWSPSSQAAAILLCDASAYNPSMALLIDGYNLLNVTGIFGEAGPGTALHRTRLAFLNFLASSFTKRER